MKNPAICPHCHMPMRLVRWGVSLTPMKAQILDAVIATGTAGITTRDLAAHIYAKRRPSSSILLRVRQHIAQLNGYLVETDHRVISKRIARWSREDQGRRWVLRTYGMRKEP